MQGSSTFRTVLTALFAALICVATMFIRVPSPVSGYINLGDGFVLLSAFLLGPSLGTAAAGTAPRWRTCSRAIPCTPRARHVH